MANEISSNGVLTVNHGGVVLSLAASKSWTISGSNKIGNVQTVGTSNEALQLGDVAAPLALAIENKDTTNYVEISLDNAQAQVISKLWPGGFLITTSPTATLYAKANTAPVNIAVVAATITPPA